MLEEKMKFKTKDYGEFTLDRVLKIDYNDRLMEFISTKYEVKQIKLNEVEILRCTYHQDIKGVDIYEGEKVKAVGGITGCNVHFIGIVKFYEGNFVIDNGSDCMPLWSEEYYIEHVDSSTEMIDSNNFSTQEHKDAKPFYEEQFDELNKTLVNCIDRTDFTPSQLSEIYKGVKCGLDVKYYLNSKLSNSQMEQIRLGLEDGLNVEYYVSNYFNSDQMEQIRLGLKSKIDISKYCNTHFNYEQMREVRKGLEQGLNVDSFCNCNLDPGLMNFHRLNMIRLMKMEAK